MQKNPLGKTDLHVSKICLGTMTWGEQNTVKDAFEQMDYALDHGVNFIDTAEMYAVPPREPTCGLTETYLGQWLAETKRRDDIVLATKMAGPGLTWIREARGLVGDDIESAIDGSLKRLQTDVIDLYQIHWPQRTVQLWGRQNYHESMVAPQAAEQLEAFYRALARIQKSGKVRHFGLSNESPWGVMKYQQLTEKHQLPAMVSIQNAYSILRRDFEVGLSEIALYEKIGLLAYSPLCGGVMSGKYLNNQMPEGSRFKLFPDLMGYYKNDRTTEALKLYLALAEELNISLTQLALAYVNDRPFMTSNIIGATTLEQLEENISSADISLSEESLKRIDEIFTQWPNPGNY